MWIRDDNLPHNSMVQPLLFDPTHYANSSISPSPDRFYGLDPNTVDYKSITSALNDMNVTTPLAEAIIHSGHFCIRCRMLMEFWRSTDFHLIRRTRDEFKISRPRYINKEPCICKGIFFEVEMRRLCRMQLMYADLHDEDTKLHWILKLGAVYGKSYLTIVAADGDNASHGVLALQTPSQRPPQSSAQFGPRVFVELEHSETRKKQFEDSTYNSLCLDSPALATRESVDEARGLCQLERVRLDWHDCTSVLAQAMHPGQFGEAIVGSQKNTEQSDENTFITLKYLSEYVLGFCAFVVALHLAPDSLVERRKGSDWPALPYKRHEYPSLNPQLARFDVVDGAGELCGTVLLHTQIEGSMGNVLDLILTSGTISIPKSRFPS
ncbi:hypothetical protein BT63DRAFT_478027 [Microthyrium microscopicum]|uniref:Uncharacterized protein n=1 Tax=Microthyrium microscopicum TaxID=703497 RepID=A0A6A6UDZ5_9PEZI|nr:hypothetical protein BT63DRAFT_478027 [Microthyrium microscopicum]